MSNPTDKRTNKQQTDGGENITFLVELLMYSCGNDEEGLAIIWQESSEFARLSGPSQVKQLRYKFQWLDVVIFMLHYCSLNSCDKNPFTTV